MSRIGRQPIVVPENTDANFAEGTFSVRGPKGELSRSFSDIITISVKDGNVELVPQKISKFSRSLWGTYASHVRNMITGVTEGFEKKLVIEGVGYKVGLEGKTLVLSVGFSHVVRKEVPEGVTVKVEKNTILISGIDKELVGQFAAQVRAIKKPEPYKGKGIRYEDEVVRRKQGKRAVA